MHYNDLIQLYFERCQALQWYWTLYVVIIGGLLAFSSLRQRPSIITGVLVTILYCCFAYKNAGAISDAMTQRQATLQLIREYPAADVDTSMTPSMRQTLEETLVAPDIAGTMHFHTACDALTILALWAMEWRRIRSRPIVVAS